MDDIDWEALGRQFREPDEEALMKVVALMGRAQARYFNALLEQGIPPLAAMKITALTIKEIGGFARETVPVLAQLFIEAAKGQE